MMETQLQRFLIAQEKDYLKVLEEMKAGRKQSHWMWYVFPQWIGLGHSEMATFYAIKNLEEAKAYLAHPILGSRLREISQELLKLNENDPFRIFGKPDNLKLQSCMTLFFTVDETKPSVFQQVIEKYFNRQWDERTLRRIHADPLPHS
ncbi:MAG: DUF1810 domain-containing protein [Microbacter sp.]